MADKFSKDDFLEWYHNPVTEQFFIEINDKINSETWSLVENAGKEVANDARSSGKIMALGELLNWKPETFMEEVVEVEATEEGDSNV